MTSTQESVERGSGAQLSLVTTIENRETPDITLTTVAGDAGESTDTIHMLRRFHLGDPSAIDAGGEVEDNLLPALLHPYRDVTRIRYEYPLYLYPAGREVENIAVPLSKFLTDTIASFAPGEESAKMLRDNLPWLERDLRAQLRGTREPVPAKPLIGKAAAALQKQMGLSEENRDKLQLDLDNLLANVAEDGQFLSYSRNVPVHLLLHAVAHRTIARRRTFRSELDRAIQGLQELLRIDRSKSGEGAGSTSRYFNPSFKGVTGQFTKGSESMSASRRERVQGALATLEAYREDAVMVHCVSADKNGDLDKLAHLRLVSDPDPCVRAGALYDEEAARAAALFKGVRVAKLEIGGAYDPAIHDSWFENFDWQAFSREELELVPTVVALVTADHIAGEGIGSFSRLMLSGKPVQIVALVPAFDNPGVAHDADPLMTFRMELGYFAIGHRQAVVVQSSASRHEHLVSGYLCALDAIRTGLHLIDHGYHEQDLYLDPWIVASAALESRAHPYVQINPMAGDATAERLNFTGNPQSEVDWPINPLEYRDGTGETCEMELPFTFADYALLVPQLRAHFRVVPEECSSDDLIPVDEYLALPSDQADRRLPFVWAVDGKGRMRRVLASRIMMFACRDRLNYWHTLQELSGVRNRHVELAVERVREEERVAAQAAIEELTQQHVEEVETVRSETAGEVMTRLADVLLGMDLTAMAAAPAVAAPSAPAPADDAVAAAAPEVEEAPAPAPEEEVIAITEPYIDSILCTTCDDCMSVNKLMFQYNDNKQAYIADPRAGTYAQLVEAAEACPASCIHPGKPLNPSEPGLDELIARAAAYN